MKNKKEEDDIKDTTEEKENKRDTNYLVFMFISIWEMFFWIWTSFMGLFK